MTTYELVCPSCEAIFTHDAEPQELAKGDFDCPTCPDCGEESEADYDPETDTLTLVVEDEEEEEEEEEEFDDSDDAEGFDDVPQ
jgi:hypothetical protein